MSTDSRKRRLKARAERQRLTSERLTVDNNFPELGDWFEPFVAYCHRNDRTFV